MLRKLSALSALCSLSLFLQACGSSSALASTNGGGGGGGTTSAYITVSANSLTFPNTTVGQTSAAQTVTVTNTGTATATLTSVVLTGNNADFTQTATTCGSTLAASASCTISITFTPLSASTFSLTVTVTDTATNSPQSLTLTGTGIAATSPTPLAVLSPTSLTFPSTTVATSSATQTITLSNPGNATLTGIAISLTGTNASSYSDTTTCGTTLAATATCNIVVTFTPTTTGSLTATLSVADNATNSPQTASLTGTGSSGSSGSVTYQLLTFGLAANGATGTYYTTAAPLYTFINSAKKTIDMTMYEMQDTTFTADLVAQCAAGVKVRVIFSASVASSSSTAYNALNTAGSNCAAEDSNTAFTNTHQKTITIDSGTSTAQTAIMSLNLQSQYYSTTRDFAMIENDPVDIAAIEATFAQDWAAGTPYNSTQGPSDFSYQPGAGDDLIWSPTTAQTDMLALITNAKSTILLENEEMSASNIVSALETACQNGVTVHIAMVNSSTSPPYSTYSANFKALEAAGCGVRTYPDTTNGIYIHAKAVIADYGLSTQKVYMGSINYSTASMTQNRELGMYISDAPSITTLYSVLSTDYAGATTF
jgi:phosphatidylserine/phosphatidylglycerophosphate/cardiolipin synthase-like enzyme